MCRSTFLGGGAQCTMILYNLLRYFWEIPLVNTYSSNLKGEVSSRPFHADRPQQDPVGRNRSNSNQKKYSNRKKEGKGNPAFPPKHQRFKQIISLILLACTLLQLIICQLKLCQPTPLVQKSIHNPLKSLFYRRPLKLPNEPPTSTYLSFWVSP